MPYLDRFHRSAAAIEGPEGRRAIARIDAAAARIGEPMIGMLVEVLLERRRAQVADIAAGRREEVLAASLTRGTAQWARPLREGIGRYLNEQAGRLGAAQGRLDVVESVVLVLGLVCALVTLAALAGSSAMIRRRGAAAEAATRALGRRSEEVAALLGTSEMLQSCQSAEDVEAVVTHAAREVLPAVAGALYVFSHSRDRLDRAAAWAAVEGGEGGGAGGAAAAVPDEVDHFAACDCWALKRGRPHRCGGGGPACAHASELSAALCVPMAARGEVYGVLQFRGPGLAEEANAALANALADGVSMALANLSLREKLRGQALRDPLTGLYNRRFLEEMTERLAAQAERRRSPLAVALLDVDHFKRVNDEYGHAAGDAVLRGLGAVLLGCVRRSDIACRFGGEELLLLLPDCDLDSARDRLEEIRRRVAAMHDGRDTTLPRVTVSAGVAALPLCAATVGEAIRAADGALYAAKRAGRDRVMVAPPCADDAPGLPGEAAPPAAPLRLVEAAGGED